jgi:hypothetical protein
LCQHHRVSEAKSTLSSSLIVFPEISPRFRCFGVLWSYGVPQYFGFIWNSTPSKEDKVKLGICKICVYDLKKESKIHFTDTYPIGILVGFRADLVHGLSTLSNICRITIISQHLHGFWPRIVYGQEFTSNQHDMKL